MSSLGFCFSGELYECFRWYPHAVIPLAGIFTCCEIQFRLCEEPCGHAACFETRQASPDIILWRIDGMSASTGRYSIVRGRLCREVGVRMFSIQQRARLPYVVFSQRGCKPASFRKAFFARAAVCCRTQDDFGCGRAVAKEQANKASAPEI